MESRRADVVILGSGFAGSIAAMILKQLGRQPLVVDRAVHPRFAIGESSTPIANRLLLDLSARYDLPQLAPLAKWGTWDETYPKIRRGKKRGFSYFTHHAQVPFVPTVTHRNELLVAASSSDDQSDTQWFRADVDQFLVEQARALQIEVLDGVTIHSFQRQTASHKWQLSGSRAHELIEIEADFILDGTGDSSALAQTLALPSQADRLHTHSRAIFSHWVNISSWDHWLTAHGGHTQDYPFPSDDAAQHHLFDGAWMWMLRFSHQVASVGIALDPRRWPLPHYQTAEQEWDDWLKRYPSVREILGDRCTAQPPGRVIRTGRLQRCWSRIVGAGWAMLPHSAGFIDPLHSSGIAHSLCGVERLARLFEDQDWRKKIDLGLAEYQQAVLSELTLIDQLVAACYSTFHHFPLLIANSMLYFAAATTYERRRHEAGYQSDLWFLLANDVEFTETLKQLLRQLTTLLNCPLGASHPPDSPAYRQPTAHEMTAYQDAVARAIAPFNHVGLCDWQNENMYRYTVAPE